MIEATESLLPACKPRWKETFRKICFFLKKVFTKPETCGMILFVRERRKRERIEYGALAQLVEQAFRCLSPVPILHRKAVNVKSAQNLAGIFGAIAQLVARYIRIVEVRGSNPLSSTKIVREHSFRTIILYHLSKHQSCKRKESRSMQDIRS